MRLGSIWPQCVQRRGSRGAMATVRHAIATHRVVNVGDQRLDPLRPFGTHARQRPGPRRTTPIPLTSLDQWYSSLRIAHCRAPMARPLCLGLDPATSAAHASVHTASHERHWPYLLCPGNGALLCTASIDKVNAARIEPRVGLGLGVQSAGGYGPRVRLVIVARVAFHVLVVRDPVRVAAHPIHVNNRDVVLVSVFIAPHERR